MLSSCIYAVSFSANAAECPDAKAKLEHTKYGLMSFDVLLNYQYYDNMQPRTNNGKTEGELYRTNLKRPLTIYSYDCNAAHFVVDVADSRYTDYYDSLSHVEMLFGRQIPKIIQAADRTKAIEKYNETVNAMQSYNLDLVLSMNAEAYNKTKQKLGVTYGWPTHVAGYNAKPDRLHPNGDLTLYRTY